MSVTKIAMRVAAALALSLPTWQSLAASTVAANVRVSQRPDTSPVSAPHDSDVPSGMVLVPAGPFRMGNSTEPSEGNPRELPPHRVNVSAFYMGKYDVTKAVWDRVYRWATNHDYHFDNPGSGKAPDHPVQTINWYDCVKWCNARSEKAGKVPCYYTDASQTTVYRSGDLNLSNACVNWHAGGYRLPTEAEWEKAARGGLSGRRFPWGDTICETNANYYSTGTGYYTYDLSHTGYNRMYSDGVCPYTSPVGSFAPNGYGLYDMAGDVWQWCWDRCGAYSAGSQSNPRGPSSGLNRVIRGGGWDSAALLCRSANRYGNWPGDASIDLGFRCVLPVSGRKQAK